MSPAELLLTALGLHLVGGLLPFARARRSELAAAAASAAGSVVGLVAALAAIVSAPAVTHVSAPWHVPGGALLVRVDALSAAFLLVIFLVSGLGAVYGLGYWSREEQPRTAPSLRFFFSLMTVGLGLVVTAAHAVLFLVAWELMAVAAFFLVATEDERAEVRRAAWVYLVATHAGTACLILAFTLLRSTTGSFVLGWAALPPATILRPDGPGAGAYGATASLVFLLGVVGFGLKAGLVPFHFWLPAAHASAPSHVSALMSGVMLKAGVYGILRFSSLVDVPPLWWAFLLAGLGGLSAVCGIALASGQSDLKRALAYSSIENVGIIVLGIGLAMAGRSLGEPAWVALGFGGALFHVFSHGCFKPLLFLGAGSVVHAAGTRDMDLLGGLLRRMPATSGLFLVGALAAAGLPLLNGFVGEWLIAMGLFETIRGPSAGAWAFAFAVPALALAGALAVSSFVRLVGVTFLGEPRSEAAAAAHEASPLLTAPMAILAALCLALGLAPTLAVPVLLAAQTAWSGRPIDPTILTAHLLPAMGGLAILVLALAGLAAAFASRSRRAERAAPTWDCGYVAASPRVQYTASSFGASTTALLPEFLRAAPDARLPEGALPGAASFRTTGFAGGSRSPRTPHEGPGPSGAPDPFGARLYEPFVDRVAERLGRLRWLQNGQLTLYLVYIFVATLATLAWSVVRPYVR